MVDQLSVSTMINHEKNNDKRPSSAMSNEGLDDEQISCEQKMLPENRDALKSINTVQKVDNGRNMYGYRFVKVRAWKWIIQVSEIKHIDFYDMWIERAKQFEFNIFLGSQCLVSMQDSNFERKMSAQTRIQSNCFHVCAGVDMDFYTLVLHSSGWRTIQRLETFSLAAFYLALHWSNEHHCNSDIWSFV